MGFRSGTSLSAPSAILILPLPVRLECGGKGNVRHAHWKDESRAPAKPGSAAGSRRAPRGRGNSRWPGTRGVPRATGRASSSPRPATEGERPQMRSTLLRRAARDDRQPADPALPGRRPRTRAPDRTLAPLTGSRRSPVYDAAPAIRARPPDSGDKPNFYGRLHRDAAAATTRRRVFEGARPAVQRQPCARIPDRGRESSIRRRCDLQFLLPLSRARQAGASAAGRDRGAYRDFHNRSDRLALRVRHGPVSYTHLTLPTIYSV